VVVDILPVADLDSISDACRVAKAGLREYKPSGGLVTVYMEVWTRAMSGIAPSAEDYEAVAREAEQDALQYEWAMEGHGKEVWIKAFKRATVQMLRDDVKWFRWTHKHAMRNKRRIRLELKGLL
jgi:hypothetical protein